MLSIDLDRPTILIVEDEVFIALMLEEILVGAGYRILIAPDGPRALLMANSSTVIAGAVVDLNLGHGMDGREVLRRLRQTSPNMPAVVVTGFDGHAPQADLRGLGGPTTRIEKPFEPDVFLATLAEVLHRPHGDHKSSERERRASASS